MYLKYDVLSLLDAFEKVRNNSSQNYGLWLNHYLIAPGLSWNAMLKVAKIELEHIPEPDTYISFEKGIRDGISYISNGYSKTNNKCLIFYDPKEESKYIVYWHVNNLYGYVMTKFLPTSGFKWLDPKEFDLNQCISNGSKGCILKVDLEYPKELHIDYSLAPDKIEIKREILYETRIN